MALVHRDGRPYLYRSIRRDGRVTSEYVASGIDSQPIAALEADEREGQRADREADRAERREADDLERALGDLASPGARGLVRDCHELGKPWVHVQAGISTPRIVAMFLRSARVQVVMVAGNRESRAPGIGDRVESFLGVVLDRLAASG